MALRLRRGTNADRQAITFDEGELVFSTDTNQLFIGDGITPGGVLVSNIGGSPAELGRDLDLNEFDITGTGTIGDSNTTFVGDGSGLTNLNVSVDNLSDVSITAPTAGDVLLFNGSTWGNSDSLNGSFVGDLIGDVFSNDSVKVVDGTTGTITAQHVQFGSYETANRPLGENGMVIYNSTINKFQGYADGSWVDLH